MSNSMVAVPLIQLFAALVTGLLARRKGYNFLLWLLGGGIIGLIVLSWLPFVNKMEEGDERRSKTTRGNVIGGVLVALSACQALAVAVLFSA